MFRITKFFIFVLFAAGLALLSIENVSAITRTARTINFVEFYGGSSLPTGTYSGLPDFDFLINNRPVNVDADDVYDNSFHLGLGYGQVRGSHLNFSVGFRYTKHDVMDTIPLTIDTILTVDTSTTYNQFDIDFNLNFMLSDINKSLFSPYVGAGVKGGLLSISGGGLNTQREAVLGLSINFGADLKIWTAKDKLSMLTLSSINSYDYYGANERPKYLNLAVGLKYYFRP